MLQVEIELIKAQRVADKLLTTQNMDFIDFTSAFHNLVYILKGVFDLLSKDEKERVGSDYFPQIVKMLREVKMHDGDDFLKIKSVSLPGITNIGGPLRIRNEGTIIINGQELPQGDISFGKEIDTIDGIQKDLGIPSVKSYEFRAISLEAKDEKKYYKHNQKFVQSSPMQFISDAIKYYKLELNGTA